MIHLILSPLDLLRSGNLPKSLTRSWFNRLSDHTTFRVDSNQPEQTGLTQDDAEQQTHAEHAAEAELNKSHHLTVTQLNEA